MAFTGDIFHILSEGQRVREHIDEWLKEAGRYDKNYYDASEYWNLSGFKQDSVTISYTKYQYGEDETLYITITIEDLNNFDFEAVKAARIQREEQARLARLKAEEDRLAREKEGEIRKLRELAQKHGFTLS
jgi:hypothetical protein